MDCPSNTVAGLNSPLSGKITMHSFRIPKRWFHIENSMSHPKTAIKSQTQNTNKFWTSLRGDKTRLSNAVVEMSC